MVLMALERKPSTFVTSCSSSEMSLSGISGLGSRVGRTCLRTEDSGVSSSESELSSVELICSAASTGDAVSII